MEKTTLLQIADCLDISFVDTKWRSGTEDNDCFISSGMGSFFNQLYEEMDRACREQLKKITLEDITLKIRALKELCTARDPLLRRTGIVLSGPRQGITVLYGIYGIMSGENFPR